MSDTLQRSIGISSIPFDGNNYALWKLKALAYIASQQWMDVITHPKQFLIDSETKSDALNQGNTDDAEKVKLKTLLSVKIKKIEDDNNKAFSFIVTSLKDRVLGIFRRASASMSAYDIWQAMNKHYEKDTVTNKHVIRQKLYNIKYNGSDDINLHIDNIVHYNTLLENMKDGVSDSDLLYILFNSLPSEYDNLVEALKLNQGIKFDTAIEHVIDKYDSIKLNKDRSNGDQANLTQHRFGKNKNKIHFKGRGPSGNSDIVCSVCNKPGHESKSCYRTKICNKCKTKGHIAKYCRTNKNKNNNDNHENKSSDDKQKEKSKLHDYSALGAEQCFLSVQDHGTTVSNNKFIIDSGATSHYIYNADVLHDTYKPFTPAKVATANNTYATINMLGKTVLKGENNNIVLHDVKHVPDFSHNLLSVAKLTDTGATVTFTNDNVLIKQDDNVLTGDRVGDLYIFNNETTASHNNHDKAYIGLDFNKLNLKEKLDLYHQRCGHISHAGIRDLVKANAVIGLDYLKPMLLGNNISETVCNGCMLGKAHRQPFGNYSLKYEATQILERIYSDLCGPVNLKNLKRNEIKTFNVLGAPLYVSVIVDEKSRFIDGKLLKYKSDATEHIITFITHHENLLSHTVKYFHSDFGGEYRSDRLKNYFNNKGIKIEYTTTNTPQHNAKVERVNRTTFNSARSMLHHANLSPVFWGEAVLTAIAVLNFRLTTHNKEKTPYELMYGNKPHVHRLRVFGCDTYAYVADAGKIDHKSIKCIFIGYSLNRENGYKLYDYQNHKIITTRDVTFIENSFTFGRGTKDQNDQENLNNNNGLSQLLIFTNNVEALDESYSKSSSNNENPKSKDLESKVVSESDIENKYRNDDNNDTSSSISNPVQNDNNGNVESTKSNAIIHSDKDRIRIAPTEELRRARIEISNAANVNHNNSQVTSVNQDKKVSSPIGSRTRLQTSINQSIVQNRNQSNYVSDVDNMMNDIALNVYDANNDNETPLTYSEAISGKDKVKWKQAIDEEIKSLMDNKTFNPIKRSNLPVGGNIMDSKWVFKIKRNDKNEIERYKARLCARGFTQKHGIDYNETFAPVLKYKSLRILLSLAAVRDYEIKQMDVETAFLNGTLEEQCFMEVPEGFDYGGDKDLIVQLLKSLYGTKQASHVWNVDVNKFIISTGFRRLSSDTCMYVKTSKNGNIIILSIFVDDIVIAYDTSDSKEWEAIKQLFMNKYKMKDLGNANFILGMKIIRDRKNKVLTLDQSVNITNMLKKFEMIDSKPVPTPESTFKLTRIQCHDNITNQDEKIVDRIRYMSAIGSLLYVSLGTRPDIAHAVNEVSKFMQNPCQEHWIAVKRIMRYLNGTINKCLVFKNNNTDIKSLNIEAYCDADWAGDKDDRKSTTGVVIKLNGNTISWLTRKQKTISLSTAEAEYMAIGEAAKEITWINQLLTEMFDISNSNKIHKEITLYGDNQAALLISKNDVYHDRTKHIDIRHHFVRECLQQGLFKIKWIATENQLADIFTKGLSSIQFNKLCSQIMNHES
jgi:hypothetical protein